MKIPCRRTLVLATVLALAACGKKGPVSEEQPPTPSARTPWVKARSSEGVPLLEAPAQVLPSPEGQAAVVPPYRARVLKVLVRPGQMVRKGQPLVEVVMPEVSTAAGAYAAASTRVDAYGRRKAQLEALKADGLVRLADVLEAETKLAEAKADQQSAAAASAPADRRLARPRPPRTAGGPETPIAAWCPPWSGAEAGAWVASRAASRWCGWPARATPAWRPALPVR